MHRIRLGPGLSMSGKGDRCTYACRARRPCDCSLSAEIPYRLEDGELRSRLNIAWGTQDGESYACSVTHTHTHVCVCVCVCVAQSVFGRGGAGGRSCMQSVEVTVEVSVRCCFFQPEGVKLFVGKAQRQVCAATTRATRM